MFRFANPQYFWLLPVIPALILLFWLAARNRRRNSRYRTPQDTAPANPVGRSIRSVYCQKDMPAPLIRYMLVGLPIISAMLHVLAATNSETRYGTGSIRALAAK